jgi:hypothetical protein
LAGVQGKEFSVKRLLYLAIPVLLLILIAVWAFLINKISGGSGMRNNVISALKTNVFFAEKLSGSNAVIKPGNGPWRVYVNGDGLRHGFYSFSVVKVGTNVQVKVEWQQTVSGVNITRISQQRLFGQDNVLWQVK